MRQNGVLTYLHGDHLGSASLATNISGAKVLNSDLRYLPYGATRPGFTGSGLPTDRRFTGQREEAALGFYDYHARQYDSTLGRFLQADAIVPNPSDPQSLNRYSYVNNNPIKNTDPTGHCIDGISTILCVAAVAGFVGGTVNLAVDYTITTQILHEEYSLERAGIAFGIGAISGVIGAIAIPSTAGIIGVSTAKIAMSLGSSASTAATMSGVTTVLADATLAGSVNAALGSTQGTLIREIEEPNISDEIFIHHWKQDFYENSARDFRFGFAGSILGQGLSYEVDINFPAENASSGIRYIPPGFNRSTHPYMYTDLPVHGMGYTPLKPLVRVGAQVTANALSNSSFLDYGKSFVVDPLLKAIAQ